MLLYEILLTRISALRLLFHFSFLVISNCLLGIAASGSLITFYQEKWKRNERRMLQLCSGAYLVSLVAAYVFLLNFPLPETPNLGNPRDFLVFTLFNAAGAIPFFTGGLVIGMIISFNAGQVNRLYGADLVAAALGSISHDLIVKKICGSIRKIFLIGSAMPINNVFILIKTNCPRRYIPFYLGEPQLNVG